jgi:hypothetical protein
MTDDSNLEFKIKKLTLLGQTRSTYLTGISIFLAMFVFTVGIDEKTVSPFYKSIILIFLIFGLFGILWLAYKDYKLINDIFQK